MDGADVEAIVEVGKGLCVFCFSFHTREVIGLMGFFRLFTRVIVKPRMCMRGRAESQLMEPRLDVHDFHVLDVDLRLLLDSWR